MSRKSRTFGQLLEYFNKPDLAGPALTHNLTSAPESMDAIRREFFANSRHLPPRRNGNMLFHEVLSFAKDDADRVTPTILEDLTRRYLELRAPYALAYAKPHFDTDNPHVHLLISANEVGSTRRLRLSKRQFHQV